MYTYELRKGLEKDFHKLRKKDSDKLKKISKKIKEIITSENVTHYKNLKRPMQHLKRVHVDTAFVLVFSVNEINKKIIFEDFDHHDKIYTKYV